MDLQKRDQLSSLFWLIFSAIFCLAALRLSLGTFQQPGPGFFPFLGGAALGLLSLANFLKTFKAKAAGARPGSSPSAINWKNIFLALAVLFAFPFLLEIIGFAPTTFLFFVFLLRFIQPQKWLIVLGGSFVATFFFFCLFQLWLKIKFPLGFFGI